MHKSFDHYEAVKLVHGSASESRWLWSHGPSIIFPERRDAHNRTTSVYTTARCYSRRMDMSFNHIYVEVGFARAAGTMTEVLYQTCTFRRNCHVTYHPVTPYRCSEILNKCHMCLTIMLAINVRLHSIYFKQLLSNRSLLSKFQSAFLLFSSPG